MGNFVFKIIPHIIQERLKKILPQVISKEQTQFICGRSIHANIVLASKLMGELQINQHGGNVALKIDIQQAYNTLEWSFRR